MELNRKRAVELAEKIKIRYGSKLPLRLTRAEVAAYNTDTENCLVIVNKGIYDVTDYLNVHPGGKKLLLKNSGQDATADFEAGFHSQIARMLLDHLKVGQVVGEKAPSFLSLTGGRLTSNYQPPRSARGTLCNPLTMGPPRSCNPLTLPGTFLKQAPMDLITWGSYKIIQTRRVNHNTKIIKLSLPSPTMTLVVPPGHHVFIGRKLKDGTIISRPYTPIATSQGTIELLVKEYPGGAVSSYLNQLKPGELVLMRGPAGNYELEKDKYKKHLILIAGGTGIAVMLAVIRSVLIDDTSKHYNKDSDEVDDIVPTKYIKESRDIGKFCAVPSVCTSPAPKVILCDLEPSGDINVEGKDSELKEREKEEIKITLLLCNRMKLDILCQREIEEIKANYPTQLNIVYHYSGERTTNGSTGHITSLFLSECVPKDIGSIGVLVCGPESFNTHVAILLQTLGYDKSAVTLFQ